MIIRSIYLSKKSVVAYKNNLKIVSISQIHVPSHKCYKNPTEIFLTDLFRPPQNKKPSVNLTLTFSCDGQLNPSSATEAVDPFYILPPTIDWNDGNASTNNCGMKETKKRVFHFFRLKCYIFYLSKCTGGGIFRECCSKLRHNISFLR